jgi:hypothetical protein
MLLSKTLPVRRIVSKCAHNECEKSIKKAPYTIRTFALPSSFFIFTRAQKHPYLVSILL